MIRYVYTYTCIKLIDYYVHSYVYIYLYVINTCTYIQHYVHIYMYTQNYAHWSYYSYYWFSTKEFSTIVTVMTKYVYCYIYVSPSCIVYRCTFHTHIGHNHVYMYLNLLIHIHKDIVCMYISMYTQPCVHKYVYTTMCT